MKRFISIVVSLMIVVSIFASVPVTAEDIVDSVTTPTEKVHFDIDFEDYTSTNTNLITTATGDYGHWTDLGTGAGGITESTDGKAFKITDSSGYALYTPTTAIESGKWLLSADVSYKTNGTTSRTTWVMINKGVGAEYFYLYSLNAGATISATNINYNAQKTLFTSKDADEMHTLDLLIDFDNNKKIYYVDGVQAYEYTWDTATLDPVINKIKFNYTDNINTIDNLRLVENPSSYSFEVKGDVTTDDDFITVDFSRTVVPSAADFVIADSDDATEDITISSVEKVTGSIYKLKLSKKLTQGAYTLKLAENSELKGVGDVSATNTESDFSVKAVYTYFDIDFEQLTENFNYMTYFESFNEYGTWNQSNGSVTLVQGNANRFKGDVTNGVTTKTSGDASTTRSVFFKPTTPITSGKLTISFDAAFDATVGNPRQQMLYLNADGTNGNLLIYGTATDNTVIGGAKANMHYSANKTVKFVDNQAYRWDTVFDLDAHTVKNYCDGVLFNSVTLDETRQASMSEIVSVYFRFKPAITFFDNFKMTLNVNEFKYSATDIAAGDNKTILTFDDTISLEKDDVIFTDANDNVATVSSFTKITPRKYEFVLDNVTEGRYKVSLASGVTSAIGNTAGVSYATFDAEGVPSEFIPYEYVMEKQYFFDFESPKLVPSTDGAGVVYNNTIFTTQKPVTITAEDGTVTYDHQVDAIVTEGIAQHGDSSLMIKSNNYSNLRSLYFNNSTFMGRQGDMICGSIWVYYPSDAEGEVSPGNNVFDVYIVVADTSDTYYAKGGIDASTIEKDKWVEIPIKSTGIPLDGSMKIMFKFKGTRPIYVDNLQIGAMKEYVQPYYFENATHDDANASVTLVRRNETADSSISIVATAYDKDNKLIDIKTFDKPAEAKATLTWENVDSNFNRINWFAVDDKLYPCCESVEDYKETFTVMSYNMGKFSYGSGAGVEADEVEESSKFIRDMISANQCDVLCAQEFCYYFDKARKITAYEELYQDYYPYPFLLTNSIAYKYQGQAIFSTLPIKETGTGDLTTWLKADGGDDDSIRGYSKIVVDIDGREVAFFNSHLTISGEEIRSKERAELIAEMNKYKYAVLCMDSNANPQYNNPVFEDYGYICGNGLNGEIKMTSSSGGDRGIINTVSQPITGGCIDQIIISDTLEFKSFEVIHNSGLSDHLPVKAEIAFKR